MNNMDTSRLSSDTRLSSISFEVSFCFVSLVRTSAAQCITSSCTLILPLTVTEVESVLLFLIEVTDGEKVTTFPVFVGLSVIAFIDGVEEMRDAVADMMNTQMLELWKSKYEKLKYIKNCVSSLKTTER